MGFSEAFKKWKDNFTASAKRSPTPSHDPSEEDLVSLQFPFPRHTPYQSNADAEAALFRPTSQIICHSPLDKRNKPKRVNRWKSEAKTLVVGGGNGEVYTTSKVLLSSTQRTSTSSKGPSATAKPSKTSGS